MGSLRVLSVFALVSSTIKTCMSGLSPVSTLNGDTGSESGVGPCAPCCGCPLLLRSGLNAETKFHCTLFMWPLKYLYLCLKICFSKQPMFCVTSVLKETMRWKTTLIFTHVLSLFKSSLPWASVPSQEFLLVMVIKVIFKELLPLLCFLEMNFSDSSL